jgi:hypothetical protein
MFRQATAGQTAVSDHGGKTRFRAAGVMKLKRD